MSRSELSPSERLRTLWDTAEELLSEYLQPEEGLCAFCGESSPAEPDAMGIWCAWCSRLGLTGALRVLELLDSLTTRPPVMLCVSEDATEHRSGWIAVIPSSSWEGRPVPGFGLGEASEPDCSEGLLVGLGESPELGDTVRRFAWTPWPPGEAGEPEPRPLTVLEEEQALQALQDARESL